LLFINIDEPSPREIREWMKINELSTQAASETLGISKRQFSRILSGETKARRIHALAMQLIWIIKENKKQIISKNLKKNSKNKSIRIPIK
tara:strand:- start:64 stop:333 length:270 start_codon:yes stop_codon:yes gene_type:complete